jgi:hypothetical protein
MIWGNWQLVSISKNLAFGVNLKVFFLHMNLKNVGGKVSGGAGLGAPPP